MNIFTLLTTLSLTACASAAPKTAPLVFVHGAHFNAGSLQNLIQELKLPAYAVDLGNDVVTGKSPTLNDYAQKVCKSLKGKSILAGHSQGGAVINQALGICPEKVQSLIYIAATIPFPGEKPFEHFAPRDDEYYFQAISENKEKGLFEITNKELFLEGFAQDANEEEKREILKFAKDEPAPPSGNKVKFSLNKLQEIKKLVILTQNDRIITPETQKFYSDRLLNTSVMGIASGHLPMVTEKEKLKAIIQEYLTE